MQISGSVFTDVSAVFYSSPTPPSCARSPELRHRHTFPDSKSLPSIGFLKGSRFEQSRARSCIAKSSWGGSGSGSGHGLVPVAPLQLESPVGQLLEQILQTHPHLLPAAIDQQLDNLQKQRNAQKQEPDPSSIESLYKRIAEVKEKDRQKAVEEIMYCWIVQKFIENEISMIPKVTSTSDPTGRIDFWPNQEVKLESVHSAEALEMIQNHVALVLGDRLVGLDFLDPPVPQSPFWDPDSLIRIQPEYGEDEGFMGSYDDDDGKSYRLRSYVMYLDAETLQRYATIRSKEAISLIEKQTQALFGRPDITVSEDGSLGAANDEAVSVTFSGLAMLVLEAVAFGSFMWDAENYMESKYQFL
ncbi:hypothetical protein E3N88_17284 [Mikania micrantha]|uniref:Uncharacterized protein n=1 Tax=Mikania micrantha TaxID=192012 RepID=A0A5N6NU59_9ASTR|nr:hypothetical protein E3N88_17284 [Mikania micrantha]